MLAPVSERSAEHRGSAYSSAGVDYEALDAGKRSALTEAMATSGLLAALGGRAVDESRGEPAFVFELEGRAFGFVVEGLGTKSIIARQVEEQLGVDAFDNVAYDTVAAIVNDLCCVGALPMVVNAYFATGSSEWYRREDRHAALLTGWREACVDAGAAWGGGESPSLPELVHGPDIELAGSAVGLVPDGRPAILGGELAPDDEIVLVESNGLHANGSSLARLIASRLPDGYGTRLPSGRSFGEALLDRSAIYVGLVRELLTAGIGVHYLSHITGHGLLKLMRPRRELTYTNPQSARRSRGAGVSRRAGGHVAQLRLLDLQHGLRLRRVLRTGVRERGRCHRLETGTQGPRCRRRAGRAPPGRARGGWRHVRKRRHGSGAERPGSGL